MSLYNDIVTIDLETRPIENRPAYPPKDVGVSIKEGFGESYYYAYDHPTGNNATRAEATAHLRRVFESGRPILCHNTKFDISVCVEGLGLPMPDWRRLHDTMYLAFLCDPHASQHGLKPLSEQYLGWPSEEQDAIGTWAWEHRKTIKEVYGIQVRRSKGKVSKVWQYYALCPGTLAKPYAEGDTDRAHALFVKFYTHVCRTGMLAAYERERELMPILYRNEVEGMRVDMEELEYDQQLFTDQVEYVEDRLRDRLGDSTLNFDNDTDVAEALSRNGIVLDKDWSPTDTGKKWLKKNPAETVLTMPTKYRSMSKKVLKPDHYQDFTVFQALGYRNRACTALKMFMRPWLAQGKHTNGVIHTHWNQTRGDDGGTRTGRPSTSDPNFLNISKSFEDRPDGYVHPSFLNVEKLPLVRKYVMADSADHLFLHRDFSGQELRVFAHFERGELMQAYLDDPKVDVHEMIAGKIRDIQPDTVLDRTKTKIINFQSLYGGGAPALSNEMPCSLEDAKAFKKLHNKALPGRQQLVDTITRIVRRGDPIHTWGGRRYFPEEPKWDADEQRMKDYTYKLINYLIQGTASELTKQTIIDYDKHPDKDARFLVTVYDELNVSAHRDVAAKQMQVLREVMEVDRLDVPMLSDGKFGPGWGYLSKGDPV